MKKNTKLLVALQMIFGLLFYSGIDAQIEVSNDNNAGVGIVDADSKLNVKNTLRDKTFRLHSDFDGATIYGIENRMQGNSTDDSYGMKTTFLGTGNNVYGVHNLMNRVAPKKYGFYNQFTGKSTSEDMYGVYSNMNGTFNDVFGTHSKITGSGDKVTGIYNGLNGTATQKNGIHNNFQGTTSGDLNGVYNFTSSSSKSRNEVGIYNYLNGVKAPGQYGKKLGIQNTIWGKDFNEVYGAKSNVIGSTTNPLIHGESNYVEAASNGTAYGIKNELRLKTTKTSGSVYCNTSVINGSGSPNTVFGNRIEYNVTGSNHAYKVLGYDAIINDGPTEIYGVKVSVPSTNYHHYAAYFTGKVYANGTILSSSDKRLKEDIGEITSALSSINKLKPAKYKVKSESKNKNRKEHFGFIAQEMQEVFPELVQSVTQPGVEREIVLSPERTELGPDGIEVVIPAQTQKVQDMDGEPMLAIDYIGLIPQIVGAIQEQDQKIDDVGENASQIDDKFVDKVGHKLESAEERIAMLEATIQKLLACTECEEGDVLEIDRFNLKVDQLDMTLYPNPAFDFVNLEIASEKSGVLDIKVFDTAGQLIAQDDMMLIQGVNVHRMQTEAWTSGSYFVTTTFNGVTNSQKLIID